MKSKSISTILYILLAVAGIIFLFMLFWVFGRPVTINSDTNITNNNNTNLESTIPVKTITQADCSGVDSNVCSGTTNIVHKFELVGDGCVDKPIYMYNSFDCGYVMPCDKNQCEAKANFTCERTTKKVTEYSCDNKQGCISNSYALYNDKDCGYVKLYGNKYTDNDVTEIRALAKNCRHNLDSCVDNAEYTYPKIKLGYEEVYTFNSNWEWEYERGDSVYAQGYVFTPYLLTLYWAAGKEQIYEEYTDDELIAFLQSNMFGFYIDDIIDSQKFNDRYSIGGYKITVIKYDDEVFKADSADTTCPGVSCGKSVMFNNYADFMNKTITLTIIGSKGEASGQINMAEYK